MAQLRASLLDGVLRRVVNEPALSGAWVKSQIDRLSAADQTTYLRIIRTLQELHPGVDEEKAGLVTYRGFKSRVNGKDTLHSS